MSFVVASCIASMAPVTALSQNPTQNSGKNFSSGATGSDGAKPRMRRLIPLLIPTTSAIPIVWRRRTNAYAHGEGDSLTQVERLVCSSHCKNSIYLVSTAVVLELKFSVGNSESVPCGVTAPTTARLTAL